MLAVFDYDQIELRVLAHVTQDPKLLQAFREGRDLHAQTASLIYRIPPDQVTAKQRAIAKLSNFNLAYGGGPRRIVEAAAISMREADEVYEAWHAAYPGVKGWSRRIERFCWDRGFAESLYGRKRRLPDISSPDNRVRHAAERQAVNFVVQGTAAEIAKMALVGVYRALEGFDADLVLQVHDEFVIECAEDQTDEIVPVVKAVMEDIRVDGPPVLDVPLKVSVGVGKNWSDAK